MEEEKRVSEAGALVITCTGTSLAVQWLKHHAPTAGGTGSIPARGTRSHMLHGVAKKLKSKKETGLPWWMHWIRIHLPVQGRWVRSLVHEDSTGLRATKPVHHNY